jgi:hypothetical protein
VKEGVHGVEMRLIGLVANIFLLTRVPACAYNCVYLNTTSLKEGRIDDDIALSIHILNNDKVDHT